MKKIFFLLLITFAIVSCQDSSKDIQYKSIDLSVASSNWIENVDATGLNRYYTCHFNMPEITSSVFNSGSVVGYIVLNNPTAQQNLPYVQQQNTSGAPWAQTIDFDYSEGGINIYVTNSNSASNPPTAMNFRVVIM